MNPFTRYLAQWQNSRQLNQFIEHWDELEALVIRVYKSKEATAADTAAYQRLHNWLKHHYPIWESRLEPFWRPTKVNKQVTEADPFRHLFAPETAAGFLDNWTAMQHLPAAREALNQFIRAQEAGA